MKKMISSIAAVALCSPAYAAPQIMGLRGGNNAGLQLLGTPSPSPTPSATLVPGATAFGSWTVPTTVPGPQGNSSEDLYHANVIMAWEMVPFQGVTSSDDSVCVAAFHAPTATEYGMGVKNNVQKVQFIANNGTPVDVTTATTSPRSSKAMFCAHLDQSALANNTLVEIRAVGYPSTGQPVVLQGDANHPYFDKYYSPPVVGNYSPTRYYLSPPSPNGNGSDSNNCTSAATCATITRIKSLLGAIDYSNIEVCLNAGTYSVLDTSAVSRSADSGFFTIKPCPTVAKANAIINDWGGLNAKGPQITRTHIQGVTVSGVNQVDLPDESALWVDDADWDANCLGVSQCFAFRESFPHLYRGLFITDVNLTNTYSVTKSATLYRNLNVTNINEDYGHDARFIIGGTESNVTFCCGAHPDLNQVFEENAGANHLVYGLTAVTNINQQGLFSSDAGILEDAAYVDVTVNNTGATGTYYVFQFGATGNHTNAYFYNLNLTGSLMKFDALTATNFNILDSTCTGASIGSYPGVTYYGSPSCD